MFGMRGGKVSVIDWLNLSSFDFFHIASVPNPFCPERWQPTRDIDVYIRITPRAARVVNAHRLVDFDLAVHRLRRRERDLAERHFDLRM
jgi:hypothetical protein